MTRVLVLIVLSLFLVPPSFAATKKSLSRSDPPFCFPEWRQLADRYATSMGNQDVFFRLEFERILQEEKNHPAQASRELLGLLTYAHLGALARAICSR